MNLSDRTLQNLNHYVVLGSGMLAFGGLFYFMPLSLWWWACVFDLVLFAYKMAAKLDIALMQSHIRALPTQAKGAWENWFAWYPVQMDLGPPPARFRLPGDWVFLRSVHRRWAIDAAGTGFETHYAYPPASAPQSGQELV